MCLASHFRTQGIVHQTSCVGTPQQNGRVERKHRHILNVARALLFQANLPIKFWGDAILTAAYVINRTPSSIHKGRSPYEVLYGEKPSYHHLRVFGSACYTHRVTRDKDKFAERSRLCIFLGYPFGTKGWKVFDIERNEFLISRDVVFLEDVFPYAQETSLSTPLPLTPVICDDDWLAPPVLIDRGSTETPCAPNPPSPQSVEIPARVETPARVEQTVDTSPPVNTSATQQMLQPQTAPVAPVIAPVQAPIPAAPVRHSTRVCTPSVRLKDYVQYNVVCSSNTPHALSLASNQSSTTVQGNSSFPLSDSLSDENFSPGHRAYLAAITSPVNAEPKHFKEAVRIQVWNDAMSKEVGALETKKTWDLVTLPSHKVAIGSQWCIKRNIIQMAP